jgi:protein SCO1/2
MQSPIFSASAVAVIKAIFVARKAVLVTAASLLIVQASTVAASAQEHDMHDGMHAMDHSMHEQQMSKKGSYNHTVASYAVPDIKLVDMNGEQIALRDALNSDAPVALNFIFTTCTTICPAMTSTFQQVQEKLGAKRRNVRLISISIDPENDTPSKLKAYAGKYKASSQWTFLTGTFDNSVLVQQAFGVFAGEKMNHRPVTFLKAQGSENQWMRLDGLIKPADIIKEMDKLNTPESKH